MMPTTDRSDAGVDTAKADRLVQPEPITVPLVKDEIDAAIGTIVDEVDRLEARLSSVLRDATPGVDVPGVDRIPDESPLRSSLNDTLIRLRSLRERLAFISNRIDL